MTTTEIGDTIAKELHVKLGNRFDDIKFADLVDRVAAEQGMSA
jgi:hypothetical protein